MRLLLLTASCCVALLACSSAQASQAALSQQPTTSLAAEVEPTTTLAATTLATRPLWLGQQTLPTDPTGFALPTETPPELTGRAFASEDTIPPPIADRFVSTISDLAGDPLARSTWNERCPVAVADLAYVTVSFWGFDDRPHTGELIVHQSVAADMVTIFEGLYNDRYPIEEMRIVTPTDVAAAPVGDTNNTSSFVCRAVRGTTTFSEHASGLALDINPFHNPFVKGEVVLPELASHYTDRSIDERALLHDGDPVVTAFAAIGWEWGGNWSSLKDYQHFSHNGQ